MSKISGAKMAHVCFDSADMDRTLAFYKAAFEGFKIVRSWDEKGMRVVVFDICEGVQIEVFERGNGKPAENIKWHHIAIDTVDLQAAYDHLLACGATAVIPPTDNTIPCDPPLHCPFAFVAGPDGEQIELN